MDPQELIDIYASAKSYLETNGPEDYERGRHRPGALEVTRGKYLFTIGPPDNEWDAIELENGATVRMFAEQMSHTDLKLPGEPSDFSPMPPHDPIVLRYILLTPVTEQEEALKMMGSAFLDHYVVVAVLLADDDKYVAIGANWVGKKPSNQEKIDTLRVVPGLLEELDQDLDIGTIQAAPPIDERTLSMMETFKMHELSRQEQSSLVEALQRLPDASFMEALGRLLPWAWSKNSWIATEPHLCRRAYALQQKMPQADQKNIRKAPWKTSWTLPSPYEPKIVYRHSRYDRDVERLVKIP